MRETYAAAMGQYARASGQVGRSIGKNLPLWIGVLSAVAIVALVLRQGTVAAVAGMVLGILVMMWSEKGFVSTHAPPDEDDEAP
jgi:hypothetical protein